MHTCSTSTNKRAASYWPPTRRHYNSLEGVGRPASRTVFGKRVAKVGGAWRGSAGARNAGIKERTGTTPPAGIWDADSWRARRHDFGRHLLHPCLHFCLVNLLELPLKLREPSQGRGQERIPAEEGSSVEHSQNSETTGSRGFVAR